MVTDDRSNSTAMADALLASAREHFETGAEHARRSAESYAEAAEKILEAQKLVAPKKLSLRAIAKAWDVDHSRLSRLVKWYENGADRTTSPFADEGALGRKLRQAIRERPDEVVQEVLRAPGLLDQLSAEVARRDAEAAVERSAENVEPETEPNKGPSVLWPWDRVVMDNHVLVVHDSTKPHAKLIAASAAGLPHLREFFDPRAAEDGSGDGELDVVVITDQPYGQDKEGITNDHIANWAPVYSLFKPRGGFVFCAFHPPFFRAAEDGIIEAGGTPAHYLVLDKGAGRFWGGDRLQNRADGIIYFERAGEPPWKSGRRAVSVLRPNKSRAAVDERKEIGGAHTTPKYIDILIQLVELATDPGGIVLDPFAGSGTTLIACQRTGRRFIGIEYESDWADLTVRNWQRETGRDAIVHPEFSDPVRFNDLEADPSLRRD